MSCRRISGMAALVLACGIAGVAQAQVYDPLEPVNRVIFNVNDALDRAIVRPVAQVYVDVVPRLVRTGVSNVFGNISDAFSAVNNLLQGKPEAASRDLVRFGTNSLFGIFGLFDVATEMGIDHQYEDFGQTLGHWGVGAGAYLVLPLLGPSTVRDTAALPLDVSVSPSLLVNGATQKVSVYSLQLVNKRAGLLNASRVLDDIALDKYTFVRDAYLQRRRSLVLDGDEPPAAADAAASPLPLAPPAAASQPAR